MCGILGIVCKNDKISDVLFNYCLELLHHRGPDQGDSIKIKDNFIMGYRRLSIVDSERLSMPYRFPNGNYSVFNGEIYNYRELIQSHKLESSKMRSSSDGEVILPLYDLYNSEYLSYLNGMYAISVFDAEKNKIVLSRDQFGQKPLFFLDNEEYFIFSSEINPILSIPNLKLDLDNVSLEIYLKLGYIPSPYTIYKNIFKVEPGSNVIFNLNNNKHSIDFFYDHYNYQIDKDISEQAATKKFRELLIKSLDSRFQGDFPINFALSGGLDSTTLCLIAKEILNKDIDTFTIHNNFSYLSQNEKNKFNEDSNYASFLSKKFNLKNTKVEINEFGLLEKLNDSFNSLEEPSYAFQNISLSKLYSDVASKNKVLITGDGSDEIFGGYNFLFLDYIYGIYGLLPFKIREKISKNKFFLSFPKLKTLFEKGVHKSFKDRYLNWHAVFDVNDISQISNLNNNQSEINKRLEKFFPDINKIDLKTELNDLEFSLWLREHYCIYVDKLSMSKSLELRFPFLDQDLVNFTKTLPFNMRTEKHNRKKLIKNAFKDILPNELTNRKKFGLLPPASLWLRNELKEDLNTSINKAFNSNDNFNYNRINYLIKDHIEKKKYNLSKVWSLYSLSKFLSRHS